MVGRIGIKIPSHNSLTPALFDELLKVAATSRKTVVARKIRLRIEQRYHIVIISTGLSYLAYLGALKKVQGGYKPSRLGKKIGKLIVKEQHEEANAIWNQLLKRHKLFRIFDNFFKKYPEDEYTLESFSFYLKKKAHTKWVVSKVRSRISRLCELFAEKGLIDYENNFLSPLHAEPMVEQTTAEISVTPKHPTVFLGPNSKDKVLGDNMNQPDSVLEPSNISITTKSWPIRIELKIEVSDKSNPEVITTILSFIRDLQKNVNKLRGNGDLKD